MRLIILILTLLFLSPTVFAQNLNDQLAERSKQSADRIASEKRQQMKQAVIDLANSNIVTDAVQTGDQAPNFSLPNVTGDNVELSKLLENGPVIIVFYRGLWCPYCNMTLQAYQESLSEFEEYGAQLVAISPMIPDNSLTLKEKNELTYFVLSDIGNKVAKEFRIVFQLPENIKEIYNEWFDLADYNGDQSYELPLSATYVISQQGEIVYSFLDADYKRELNLVKFFNPYNR